MCEKISESELSILLNKTGFDKNKIYHTITENESLKKIFKNCSKTGNGNGYPDRIYFDGLNLIIFECKSNVINKPLDKAISDIKIYIKKLLIQLNNTYIYNIFAVAFISSSNYNIFKLDKKDNTLINLKNSILHPETFNLNINTKYNVNMVKNIKQINNYIRDNTKISDVDKPFFIAIILISVKKNSFREIIKNYNEKKYIFDLLQENINDYDIDISIFKKFRNDNNNHHFYNIIRMVIDIFEENPDIDLLNEFYSEFVKYNNNDGKKLGIVLTPHHIVKLMVKLLNITENDTILDLCTGTGSFLIESSKYNPKKIIGCEFQNHLFALFKCNLILRNIENYEGIKGNCFENTFKATKSIINPPYGIKGSENEFEFILKQLESIDEGGLAISIIPISKLHNNIYNNRYKKQLIENSIIKTIIRCNSYLFYPNASIQCIILLLEKNSKGNRNNKVNFINYEDDGFIIQKQSGLIKTNTYDKKYDNIINQYNNIRNLKKITITDDWGYLDQHYNNIDEYSVDLNDLRLKKIEMDYIKNKTKILLNNSNIVNIPNYKSYLLTDVFNIEKNTEKILLKDIINNKGEIPYISSSGINQGIVGYVSRKTHNGNCITIAKNGSVGSCFYQPDDFTNSNDVCVIRLKEEYGTMTESFGIFISSILKKLKNEYSYSRKLSNSRLCKVVINLPVDENDKIDFRYIKNLF